MSAPEHRPRAIDVSLLRGALARVQARLGPKRDATGLAPETAPALHPLVALNRMASIWGLPSGPVPASAETPGPAGITAAATRIGLVAEPVARSLAELTPSQCPCLAMRPDGDAYLILALDAEGSVRLATHEGCVSLPLSVIAGAATRTMFRLSRAEPATSGEGGPSPVSGRAIAAVVGHFRQALVAQSRLIAALVVASVIINLLGLVLPLFTMAVFDRVIPHAAFETLWALAIGVGLALLLEMALRHARLKLHEAVAQGTSLGAQGLAVSRALNARSAELPARSGGLIQPLAELESLANMAPALVVSTLVDLPFFLLMLILIASIAGPVVWAPIIGTVAMLGLYLYAHNRVHRAADSHGGLSRRQHQLLIDTVAAQERIRVTGAADLFLARFEQTADDTAYAGHEIRYWHGLAAQLGAVLVQIVVVAAIVIGVLQIGQGAMTIGALSASILLVNRAMTPLGILTGLAFRLRQVMHTAEPAGRILTATPETGGGDRAFHAQGLRGDLAFTGVTFAYPGEDRPALSGITLSIRAGERIGLVGKSGCGKSTLLRLAVRLQEPGEGRIKLDERDIAQYDPAELRAGIGYMPQDSVLVDGTLHDNLLLGLTEVDATHFERVCRMTGVHDLAARHPQGFSLPVGTGGQRLSAGERQCVSLTRTLMGEPRLLLLDEPTSAFDNGHEARLVAELSKLPAGTGMIIATHRLALLRLVDRVIWLDGGRIVADGPRDEVFKRHGLAA